MRLHIATIAAIVALLLAAPGALPVFAAPALSVLASNDSAPYQEVLQGLATGLARQEGISGYPVHFLNSDRATDPAADAERPELLITLGKQALEHAITVFPDIPVVATMVLSPAVLKQRPNSTGVYLEIPIAEQFNWLRRFLPAAKVIGLLYDPAHNAATATEAKARAADAGLTLAAQPVPAPNALPGALRQLAAEIDVLWSINDATVINPATARNLLLFSLRNKIPMIGLSSSWVKAGALYALDRDYLDIGRQCAAMAGKILAGTPPAAIPPEPPRTILYAVNRKTARITGHAIPSALAANAAHSY